MLNETENQLNTRIRSFWISVSLLLVFVLILLLGFLPVANFKTAFLTASIIYLSLVIFWFIARTDSFKFLKSFKKVALNITKSKETKEYEKEHKTEEVKADLIGVYISLGLAIALSLASILLDVI